MSLNNILKSWDRWRESDESFDLPEFLLSSRVSLWFCVNVNQIRFTFPLWFPRDRKGAVLSATFQRDVLCFIPSN